MTLGETISAFQGPSKEEFASVLTRLHKRSGLSATELAIAAEVERDYIWHLEKGTKTAPSRRIVDRLALGLRTGPTPPTLRELVPLYLSAGLFPLFLDERDLKRPE